MWATAVLHPRPNNEELVVNSNTVIRDLSLLMNRLCILVNILRFIIFPNLAILVNCVRIELIPFQAAQLEILFVLHEVGMLLLEIPDLGNLLTYNKVIKERS